MRARTLFATESSYHLMPFDITQCHRRSVPKLSQAVLSLSCRPTVAGARLSAAIDREHTMLLNVWERRSFGPPTTGRLCAGANF